MINRFIRYLIRFIPAVFATVATLYSLSGANLEVLEKEISQQVERITKLESAYTAGEIPRVDETAFFNGDLQAELENGIKFNEMIFLGTHNSYQTPNTKTTKKLFANLSDLTFGLVSAHTVDFYSQTLTEQLNCGIRSLEMDIETFDRNGEISFTCMHSPYFEMTTSCYDFALAMKEIAMWSDNNPNHLPITIIIEPKAFFIPLENMEFFNIEYAKELDNVLRKALGDKLFTPADMLRDYADFGEMRAADDWCKVSDMLGKVLIILHDTGVTEKYISLDPSIKSQAMFPMLRENGTDRDCASFILSNKPNQLLKISDEVIKEKKLIVRTRADKYLEITDERLEGALKSGAQIISTDYPYRTDLKEGEYFVSFGNRTTVKTNK